MNTDQLAYLLELLHANTFTFTEDNFIPMLDELRRLTNSSAAFLIENSDARPINLSLLDENSGSAKLTGKGAYDKSAYDLAKYAYYHYLKQFSYQRTIKQSYRAGNAVQSHSLDDYYKYINSIYICGAVIDIKQAKIAFAVNRDRHQGKYTIEEESFLDQLIPHIKVATENRQHLRFLQKHLANITQVLESSDEALGIIDRNGKLLYCSTFFKDYLLNKNSLIAGVEHLQFRLHRHHNWLEKTINSVSHCQNYQQQTLRLSRDPLLEIQLTMLNPMEREPLFLVKLKTAASIPHWWLSVYNFTPKEQLLIDKLLTGLTLPEIAVQMQISHNTARTHLKHIFNKVHCTSQNQLLVTLLLAS
jgi:DNA-binding CsgD family transcriptional regulator